MKLTRFGHRQLLTFLYRKSLLVADIGPVVSFTFDDFPRTAYTAGGSILRQFGARGTFYAALGLMGSSNGLGDQFYLDDLYGLIEDGHELGTHTFHHVSSLQTPLSVFLEEVREGRAAMENISGLTVSNNFAYPFGAVSAAAKRSVSREMLSCRSIFGGINAPFADLNLLRANALYGDTDQLDFVRGLLDDNERRKGWLIFYTHDVRENPSPYGCTPRLFESTVKSVLERGMPILSVREVLARKGRDVRGSGAWTKAASVVPQSKATLR